jgi:hypothetical protein
VLLQKLLETKGLKLLPNVKTKWISMLSFANQILAEYKTLMFKMNDDLNIVVLTSINLKYLYGIKVVMGLTCIMLMLEVIHALIKFVQGRKTYVCVFVIVVKMCCVELYKNVFKPKKKTMKTISRHYWTFMHVPMITC